MTFAQGNFLVGNTPLLVPTRASLAVVVRTCLSTSKSPSSLKVTAPKAACEANSVVR